MITKKRKKLLVLCLSLAMLISVFPMSTFPAQETKAAGYGISNPRTDENGVSTWDCIYFGNYYQSNSMTKEPIKWRVLSVNGDDAFLLADKNLDCQPYNTERKAVTWETCTLRNWLNNDFYNAAFSDTEKSAIETTLVVNEDNPEDGTKGGNKTSDKVYLLSIQEAMNPSYGFASDYDISETRVAKNTEYAKERDAYTANYGDYVGNGWWWLRSPAGSISKDAAYVYDIGAVIHKGNNVSNSNSVVRPALHLNLSSDVWLKADTVSAAGGSIAGSTATVKPDTTQAPTATVKPDTTQAPAATVKPVTTQAPEATVKPDTTQAPAATVTPVTTQEPTAKIKPTTGPKTVTAPGKVKKLKAKNKKKKSVTLSWKKVSGAKGYQVQCAANKKFKRKQASKLTTKLTSKTKFTVKKLKKKKIYYFRVRAYKLNGKRKVYGKWSAVKRVKVKK